MKGGRETRWRSTFEYEHLNRYGYYQIPSFQRHANENGAASPMALLVSNPHKILSWQISLDVAIFMTRIYFE